MKSIRELHKKAMDLAEMAFVVKLRGDLEQADQLSRQAFEYETQAARLVPDEPSSEPTRSVLYRSAASLALDCNESREAKQLIAAGLTEHTPKEIAEELREMLKEVIINELVLNPAAKKLRQCFARLVHLKKATIKAIIDDCLFALKKNEKEYAHLSGMSETISQYR